MLPVSYLVIVSHRSFISINVFAFVSQHTITFVNNGQKVTQYSIDNGVDILGFRNDSF